MRPPKYRAWDGKQMWYSSDYSLFRDFAEHHIDAIHGQEPKKDILMQFTDLLDKNGKEIWEGDIISNYWRIKNGKSPYVVKWAGARFDPFYKILDDRDNYLLIDALRNYEVLGDIYSTPELLGKDGG